MSTVASTGVDSVSGGVLQRGVAAGPPAELRLVSGIPWSDRFDRATTCYRPLPTASAEHLEQVAVGIGEWAAILPQIDQSPSGHHLQANTWGLGPELSELRAIIVQLKLRGCRDIAEELRILADELKTTAHRLDECYPKSSSADEAAEKRLVGLARNQAGRLADLLKQLRVDLRRVQPAERPQPNGGHRLAEAHRQPAKASGKRAARATTIEALKKELIEHIKAARDCAFAAVHAKRPPMLLPRPSQAELGRRIGVPKWVVSRCFRDPLAGELHIIWETAADLDTIMKYRR